MLIMVLRLVSFSDWFDWLLDRLFEIACQSVAADPPPRPVQGLNQDAR
jgi:hypothetical protein